MIKKIVHTVHMVAYVLSYPLLLAMVVSIFAACYLKQAIPTLIAILTSVISVCHLIIWWHLDTLVESGGKEGGQK